MVTLVPSPLFEEEYLSDYLKYNTKIFKTDFITYDVIKNDDIMIVYVPFVNINNYIFERFGSFEYKHSTTVALDRILEIQKNNAKESMYINIAETYFDLVVTKKMPYNYTIGLNIKQKKILFTMYCLYQNS